MPRVFVRSFVVSRDAIDANAHVNSKEYLRWMEEIAIAHSAAQGWPMERYQALGATWYVRSHFVEYLRPAFADMPLTVATWVATMQRRASLRRYAFVRTEDRKLIAQAETLWIFVDIGTGRATEIAQAVRGAFSLVGDDDPEIAELSRLKPRHPRPAG
jgi:acyl-CoA thioester hydrolase